MASSRPTPPPRRARSWAGTLLMLATLLLGVYCVYRAVLPLVGLYERTFADALADGPEPGAIGAESFRWAAIGVPLLIVSGLVGMVMKVLWLRRKLTEMVEGGSEARGAHVSHVRLEIEPPGPVVADSPQARGSDGAPPGYG